jgi:DNA-binding NtrC family response regulator
MVPLRERADDIPVLANHFLESLCLRVGKPRQPLPSAVAEKLKEMPWPGNVRELQNVVRRAFVFAEDGPLKPQHFGFELALWRPSARTVLSTNAALGQLNLLSAALFRRHYSIATAILPTPPAWSKPIVEP